MRAVYPVQTMTIAAGFFCSDGIILAADTRHTLAYEGIFDASKAYRGTTPDPEPAKYVIVSGGAANYTRPCVLKW